MGAAMTLRELQERAKTEVVSRAEIDAVIAALPYDERLIHWSETGVKLSTLAAEVCLLTPNSVRGSWIGRELYIYPDHRLLAFQKRLGLPQSKLPEADE